MGARGRRASLLRYRVLGDLPPTYQVDLPGCRRLTVVHLQASGSAGHMGPGGMGGGGGGKDSMPGRQLFERYKDRLPSRVASVVDNTLSNGLGMGRSVPALSLHRTSKPCRRC